MFARGRTGKNMMQTKDIQVPVTPYGSAFLGAVATTSAPNHLVCRQSARNQWRVDYDETKYTEAEFNERNQSPKAATVQTGAVVAQVCAQVPTIATCIPRVGRGLPSRAVNSAQATNKESPLDVFLPGGQVNTTTINTTTINTTTINTTNRQAALATYADAIAETFLRAASSSSTESDFSTKSVPNSPTASAASAPTASTAATTGTAATVQINSADAEAAAASTSGLSKLYKYREKVNQTVVASWSALPAQNVLPAPSATLVASAPPVQSAKANKQAPGDNDMPDAAGAEPIDEISTGGVLSDPFNQVFFFEKFSFQIIPVWNNMKTELFILLENPKV